MFEIKSGRLLNMMINALVQVELHLQTCKQCHGALYRRCICGKLCSPTNFDIVICRTCGAIVHQSCWDRIGRCYCCGRENK